MRRLGIAALALFACGCLLASGCAITLEDEGKAGLYYSATWEVGVKHKSQETGGECKSTWDYQALVDYFVQLKNEETVE